jgi:proteasome lid subunit RPN8/RPN11
LTVAPLTAGAEQTLKQALRESGEIEVTGFLVADPGASGAWFWRLRNYGDQPGTFALDPGEVSRVRRAAARRGQTIVAFVHSHVSSLARSQVDRASQALTDLPWVIVRLDRDRLQTRTHTPCGR